MCFIIQPQASDLTKLKAMNKSGLCTNVCELPLSAAAMLKATVSGLLLNPSSMDKDSEKEIPERPWLSIFDNIVSSQFSCISC